MGFWAWLFHVFFFSYISNWVWSGYFSEISAFLLYHVFSVILWFKGFYKSNLAFPCFRFLWWWRKSICVWMCSCMPVQRKGYGRDGGEASVVILWVCHWYIKADSTLVFPDSGNLASSHCMIPLNWEHPGKSFTCPSHPLLLEKYLFLVLW